MAHRESIRKFMSDVYVDDLHVIDWGCGTKPIINYLKGKPASYMGIDKLDHVHATKVADVTEPIVFGAVYDLAFCIEVMEHVKYPMKLVENISRNLRIGGELYMSVPFLYPVHSAEDYWRFTDQGLRFILAEYGLVIQEIQETENCMGWVLRAKKIV